MTYRLLLAGAALCVTYFSPTLLCQVSGDTNTVTLPTGTPIYVRLDQNYSMRVGQIVKAHTSYPVYVGQQLVFPVGTIVTGHIRILRPAKAERRAGRWNGDFTPFHLPEVMFDEITLPNSAAVPIDTLGIGQGVQILIIAPDASVRHSLLGKQWEVLKTEAKSSVCIFTAPAKKDRLTQALWHQLPWHPERLSKDSEWGFEIAAPVYVPISNLASSGRVYSGKLADARTLHAYLVRKVSSAKDKAGASVEAVVSEPLYAEDKRVEVPQGSVLEGTVVEAKSAKRLGRDGKLRFAFTKIRYPEGFEQSIAGGPNGTSTDEAHPLTMDSEGGVKPAPRDRILRPLLAAFLANSALEQDSGSVGLDAAASNSFGLIGRVVGAAASSPSVAVGIGYYTALREVYSSWIARGRDVSFKQDTRIEIAVRPRTGTSLTVKAK